MSRKKILGKSTEKIGNLNIKNTKVGPSVQEENKLNNYIFLFIVMFLMVMIVIVSVVNFEDFCFIGSTFIVL